MCLGVQLAGGTEVRVSFCFFCLSADKAIRRSLLPMIALTATLPISSLTGIYRARLSPALFFRHMLNLWLAELLFLMRSFFSPQMPPPPPPPPPPPARFLSTLLLAPYILTLNNIFVVSCFGSVDIEKHWIRVPGTVDATTARSEGSDAFSFLFKTALSPTMPWPLLDKTYGDRRGEHPSVYFHPFPCLVTPFFDRTRFGGKNSR